MQTFRRSRSRISLLVFAVAITICSAGLLTTRQHAMAPQTSSFTVDQIKSYPFPNELTASATGAKIAWAFNERGSRNLGCGTGQAAPTHQLQR